MNPCRINANRTTHKRPETKRKILKVAKEKDTFSEKPPIRLKAEFFTQSMEANAEMKMARLL